MTNMSFNVISGRKVSGPSPEYDVFSDQKAPPLQANGNLNYLQYIDLIGFLWAKAYPEVKYVPMGGKQLYDPDKAYLVYSLESRKTKESNTKPRHRSTVDDPDDDQMKLGIWSQSFDNLISFTALHSNPRTAEEIIESFEDFMIEATPIFKGLGIEELIYNRRLSDDHESRFGEDLSSRSIMYQVTTQKIIVIEMDKIVDIVGQCTVFLNR
jgi:hypothetical protein